MPLEVRVDEHLHTVWVDKKEVVYELPQQLMLPEEKIAQILEPGAVIETALSPTE